MEKKKKFTVFDDSLKLNKPMKIAYGIYLISVFTLCTYWVFTQSGPAEPLIKFQYEYLNGALDVVMVFVLAIPFLLPARVIFESLYAAYCDRKKA